MNQQYIVHVSENRKEFVHYLLDSFSLEFYDYDLLDTSYPFVVDFPIHQLWICNSITCLALASQNGKILSEECFIKKLTIS